MSDDQMRELVNQVNPSNFSQTMEGYLYLALMYAMEKSPYPYQDEQIKFLALGLKQAMAKMTPEDARKYGPRWSASVEEFMLI